MREFDWRSKKKNKTKAKRARKKDPKSKSEVTKCACCNMYAMYEGPLFDAKPQHLNLMQRDARVRPTGAANIFKCVR